MALDWYPMDIVVARENEEEWVAQHGAAFEACVLAMPWRNIRLQPRYYYVVEAELLTESGMDAMKEMTAGVESCLPDGGRGVTWLGKDRMWK